MPDVTNVKTVVDEKVVKPTTTPPMFEVLQKLVGLSTDVKPTNVATGSEFFEMDTLDTYMFNADKPEWVKITPEETQDEEQPAET